MTPSSLQVIHEEHQALSAMLRSLLLLLRQPHAVERDADFAVLRAMLLYLDEFPQRLHHRKESELLFPRVLQRVPALGPVIGRLEHDHGHGERAIRELEHLLLAWEVLGPARRPAFEDAARRYVDAYLQHMALEELEILPAARRELSADDWQALDAAFAANRDPLTGHEPEDGYRPLFRRIVTLAPAPIGVGPSA